MFFEKNLTNLINKIKNDYTFRSFIVTFLITSLLLLPIGLLLDRYYKKDLLDSKRENVKNKIENYSTLLSREINEKFSLLKALEAFTKENWHNKISKNDFTRFSNGLYSSTPGIRNLVIAPDGINKYVYPIKNNEEAVGHNLIEDKRPDVRKAVQKTINNREFVASGPYKLRQGEDGIILRKALYKNNKFWGLVTMALNMKPIYEYIELENKNFSINIALKRDEDVFFGEDIVFKKNPIIIPVEFYGGKFTIAGIPEKDWYNSIENDLKTYRISTFSIMILLVIIVYILSYRNFKIQSVVNEKTKHLKEINLLLEEKEKAIKKEKEDLRTTLNSIGDAVISTDIEGRIVRINPVAEELTGWNSEDAVGKPIQNVFNIVNAKTRKKVENPVNKVLEEEKLVGLANHTVLIAKDGREYQIADSAAPIINNEDNVTGVVLVFRDVTEKYEMQEKIKASERHLDNLISNTPAVIYSYNVSNGDRGLIFDLTYINDNIQNILGFAPDELVGCEEFHRSLIHPEDRERLFKEIQKLIQSETDSITITFRFKDSSGNYHWVRASDRVVSREDKEIEIVGSWWDITELKKAEKKLQYKTFHDELTGLYNRAYFNEEKKRYDNKRQLPLSIIMGDVNGLKITNDTFGHKEGDKLLKIIAQILEKSCRQEDLIARIGGDEFVILLPQTFKEETEEIYERIKDACQKAEEGPIEPSIALGIATKTEVTDDFETILKKAEDKMYQNKVYESASVHNTILDSLKTMLRETSNETLEHSQRLDNLAVSLGNQLDLSPHKLDVLTSLADLHDLGKIAISKDILQKPGSLTDKEWEEIKEHPKKGYEIATSSPKLNDVAEGILCHHERWDGNGYPQGLAGEEIPLLARIITIVDAYDVMTNSRPYKEPMSKKEAIKELKSCAGNQFDPELVEIFVDIIEY